MKLEDGEIALRPFTEADVPALAEALRSDSEIARWTRIPSPYSEKDAREFIATTEEKAFAIVDRTSGGLVGGIGARVHEEGVVEIGYWIRSAARGHGFATRALGLRRAGRSRSSARAACI